MKKTVGCAAFAALCALSLFACGSSYESWRANVRTRAAFDMSCPEPQVQVVTLRENWNAGGSYGATGCGRQASYIYTQGQVILNSPVSAQPGAAAPAPAAPAPAAPASAAP
jgi:hypothetical protein